MHSTNANMSRVPYDFDMNASAPNRQPATAALREVLADLPYLVATADTGGVSAAADELNVPQPTVSRGLARLSAHVGAPMLLRKGRGVQLSSEAMELLPHAQRAVAAAQLGLRTASHHAEARANTVSISFQHTLGRTVVPALLNAVLADRPGTRFELHQGSREYCVETLDTGSVDFTLLSPPHDPAPGIETVRLYAEPLVLAVALDHRWAKRGSIRLNELAGEPLLAMRKEYGLRGLVDKILDQAGIHTAPAFEGEDIQTLRGLVSAGLGVAVLPPAIPSAPDVVELPILDATATREIGISWRTSPIEVAADGSAAQALFRVVSSGQQWLPTQNGTSGG